MSAELGRLLLLGAGGQGRVAADLAERLGWRDIAFLDDGFPDRKRNAAWPIVGRLDAANEAAGAAALFVSLGDNAARLALHRKLVAADARTVSLVHPNATVSNHAVMGAGVLVAAGAVVGPFAALGEAVIINTGATIDHDCSVADGVHISPGAHLAGGVSVAERAWIGIGSAVREGVSIGADVMVGAGAAVVRDVPDNMMALGVPARLRPRTPDAC